MQFSSRQQYVNCFRVFVSLAHSGTDVVVDGSGANESGFGLRLFVRKVPNPGPRVYDPKILRIAIYSSLATFKINGTYFQAPWPGSTEPTESGSAILVIFTKNHF
jgi:hypothetical protein